MSIKSINPVNGKVIRSYKEDTEKQITQKIEKAAIAWEKWRKTFYAKRAELLKQTATVLKNEFLSHSSECELQLWVS